MSDLEFVSTDDLIVELLSRHDHAVIVALKIGVAGDCVSSDKVTKHVRWKGNSDTCSGLCIYATHRIVSDYLDTAKDSEP